VEDLAVALRIGLTNGLIIAVIAIGYTLVYGILELINFAHADVFMFGTLFTYLGLEFLVAGAGLPLTGGVTLLLTFLLVLPITMLFTATMNASIERVAYRPLLPKANLISLPSGQAIIGIDEVFVLGVTIPLLLLLRWFVASTRQGKAMRATAQDREASGLMGINVNRTISLTFLIAGALAGAAGMVVALYYGQSYFQLGIQFGLLSFTAAVVGGIGNLTGATAGGIVIGLVAAMSDRFIASVWTNVIVFGILILVLVFRPSGLFAERVSERA
jgi:branched-chain amino acid transport system permease protein